MQSENTFKSKILDLLIPAKVFCPVQKELALHLGYTKDIFSEIKSGDSNGSAQLVRLLELYIELENLKLKNDSLTLQLGKLKEEKQILREYFQHQPVNSSEKSGAADNLDNAGKIVEGMVSLAASTAAHEPKSEPAPTRPGKYPKHPRTKRRSAET